MKRKEEKKLEKKIHDLFDLRAIPWMLELSGIRKKKKFLGKLVDLQKAIYLLDHTLESKWKVSDKKLKKNWKAIYRELERFNVNHRERKGFCSAILQYQKHELNLRKNRSPLELSMDFLYFYKSCDVKLMRGLMQHEDKDLKKIIHPRDWFTFDLITELNDDIADVFEDMDTYNGNRLLFEIAILGPEEALDRYRSYLEQLLSAFKEQKHHFKSPHRKWIYDETLEMGFQTRQLLEVQFQDSRIDEVRSARIFKKFDLKSS